MNSQTKWNKELLYSLILFITAISWFFSNPVGGMADFIDSLPNALDIKYGLLDLGILPIFWHTADIAMGGLFFFLLFSVYLSVLSLRKATVGGKRNISGYIPKNVPSFLAVLLIFISSTYLVIHTLIALNLLD